MQLAPLVGGEEGTNFFSKPVESSNAEKNVIQPSAGCLSEPLQNPSMVISRIERDGSGLEEPQEAGPQVVWNPVWVLE